MSPLKVFLAALALAGLVSGCAKPPQDQAELTTQAVASGSVGAVSNQSMPDVLGKAETLPTILNPKTLKALNDPSIVTGALAMQSIAGRTLYVSSIKDFQKLKPGEIILTFDDGPSPSVTPKILATLKEYGVKATFFMVGNMAKAHSKTAQLVAKAGHTIGSHSHNHENFTAITHDAALNSVDVSEAEIAAALKPVSKKPAPFFRFPYLAQTKGLRADLSGAGLVIFDVDIDSWDYLSQSTDTILNRTLRRLDDKGRGIVLFHDIHSRTAKVLPAFLEALRERGYKVVRAVPKNTSIFDMITLASLG